MKSGKHLLVIRLSAMGDVAMTVPVLLAFVDQYPEVRITVLTKAYFLPIFSELTNVQVHSADVKGRHGGVFGLWRLYKEVESLNIDAVVDLHNVLRSNILKQFFRWAGFPVEQIDKGRSAKKALISGSEKEFRQLKSTHQRYADVFSKLGFPLDLTRVTLLPKATISQKIKNDIGLESKKWIGVAPFAAFKGKMYPANLMEEVIDQLNGLGDSQILLFGGGKEEMVRLETLERKYPNVKNASAKCSFEEELQLISNLDIMLSMDSGNGHLAAMYGVPTVTLWGVTHPYAGFAPFGQGPENALLADRKSFPGIPTSIYGNKMPDGYEKAMETIRPEEIIKKIGSIVSSR